MLRKLPESYCIPKRNSLLHVKQYQFMPTKLFQTTCFTNCCKGCLYQLVQQMRPFKETFFLTFFTCSCCWRVYKKSLRQNIFCPCQLCRRFFFFFFGCIALTLPAKFLSQQSEKSAKNNNELNNAQQPSSRLTCNAIQSAKTPPPLTMQQRPSRVSRQCKQAYVSLQQVLSFPPF